MTGNNAGQVLSGSRMLFALAEHGELPSFFARIHPRFRTPSNAVIFTSVVAVLLALSGSWAKLAVVSAVARLVTYAGVSAATLRLRAPAFAASVPSATFVAPFGPIVPVVAIAMSLGVAAGATREQLIGGLAALAVGAVMFLIRGPRLHSIAGPRWSCGRRAGRGRGPSGLAERDSLEPHRGRSSPLTTTPTRSSRAG
jgi:amino acid transporter